MIRNTVLSSNIASVGYDEKKLVLEVEFGNGNVYQYQNVPQDVYKDLMTASSHGQYFNKVVKGVYLCEKI